MNIRLVFLGLFALLSVTNLLSAHGQDCVSQWVPTVGPTPGVESAPKAILVHDDGSGSEFFVGGTFVYAGGRVANGIAKWNGHRWLNLGSGINLDGRVDALAACNSGLPEGNVLYAAGNFNTAGNVPARNIAKWNGTSWAALPGTLNAAVNRLGTFTPPGASHPQLIAAGGFTHDGSQFLARIAAWTGTAWLPLGAGVTGLVTSLVSFDDGTGPALYVGGLLTMAGGQPVENVARWNGTSWSSVGAGIAGVGVWDLALYDDGLGGGRTLIASATTSTGPRLLRWNGSIWEPFGDGSEGSSMRFHVRRSTVGADQLFAAGAYTITGGGLQHRLQRWSGNHWTPLGTGNSPGTMMVDYDDGSGGGLELHAGFDGPVDGLVSNHLAKWNGTRWLPLGNGIRGEVRSLQTYQPVVGGPKSLIAGGAFQTVGGIIVRNVASWDGTTWSDMASGLGGTIDDLLVTTIGGTGQAYLYAFGANSLQIPDGTNSRLARWDGTAWSGVFPDPSFGTRMLAHDDGSGPAIYFNAEPPFGPCCHHISRWNGTSWSGIGAALNGNASSMAVYDDNSGSGPQLYASGSFTHAGTTQVSYIARWNGSTWLPLGSGLNSLAEDMVVHDDGLGGGPALFVGGSFTLAGGQPCTGLAKWDGANWTPLSQPYQTSIRRLYSAPAGPGLRPTLFAFGGVAVNPPTQILRMLRWTGSGWEVLGGDVLGHVFAFETFDDGRGDGPAVFVGGKLTIYDTQDGGLGKYQCVWTPDSQAACAGDGSGAPCPCGNDGAPMHGCASSIDPAGALLTTSGLSRLSQDSLSLSATHVQGSCVLYFQGTHLLNHGEGFAFGDGLRCVGGTVVRLGVQTSVPPTAQYPSATDSSVSIRGGVLVPGTRHYQVWYRDTGTFCTTETYNLSNACRVTWAP